MTLPKIGIISPQAGFSDMIWKLAEVINADITIEEYKKRNVGNLLKEWEDNGFDAIVSDGTIAVSIQNNTRLPIIPIRVSKYNVIYAAKKAQRVGKRVLLAYYKELPVDFNSTDITTFLELELQLFAYSQEIQLRDYLKEKNEEIDAVIGISAATAKVVEEAGLPVFMVQDEIELVRDALEKAVQVSYERRKANELDSYLQSILHNSQEGIVLVDEQGFIINFNPAAEKYTGISAKKVLLRNVFNIKEENAIYKKLFKDGSYGKEEVSLQKDNPMIVCRVPVYLWNDQRGLLIFINSSNNIIKNEVRTTKDSNQSNKGMEAHFQFGDIIGCSAMIKETIREARKYTRADAAVLITGESGTGKELFAQSIHNESERQNGPFVAINCAALPENLLESELFGYEEGAFTGAKKGGKQGLFVLAHGGTIFLDEIGELSQSLQARLLRVLQQKVVMPVGGQKLIPVDVRVISATNSDLMEKVEQGEFRVDLFYRLNILHLHIPPLRQRLEDLPLLFEHFFQKLVGWECMNELHISEELLDELKSYLWPGNVRELQGFVERYAALGEEDVKNHTTFKKQLLKLKSQGSDKECSDNSLITVKLGNMEDMERQIIKQVQKLVGGNKGEIAKVLGVSRTTVWKKLKDV